jgi:hypothetical protein
MTKTELTRQLAKLCGEMADAFDTMRHNSNNDPEIGHCLRAAIAGYTLAKSEMCREAARVIRTLTADDDWPKFVIELMASANTDTENLGGRLYAAAAATRPMLDGDDDVPETKTDDGNLIPFPGMRRRIPPSDGAW